MKGISVIVCCFNSVERLPATLLHLAKQNVHDTLPWEIILINNNSSDQTKEFAGLEWQQYNSKISFSIVDEYMPGLSAARAKGFECARYENIIFCDDDNWLDRNYVQRAYEIMNSNPDIGVLGGNIEAVADGAIPFWFNDFKYAYAVGQQGNKEGDISHRGFLWGAGMVIRKKAWEDIRSLGFQTTLSDRMGSNLNAGGDSELCLLCILLGYKLWYSPDLFLKHFIPLNRLSWKYLRKLNKGFGASDISLLPLKKIILLKQNTPDSDNMFSWKTESLNVLLLLLRHPRRTFKGLAGREGESAVLWLIYNLSYLRQLIINRSKADKIFAMNYKIFTNEKLN